MLHEGRSAYHMTSKWVRLVVAGLFGTGMLLYGAAHADDLAASAKTNPPLHFKAPPPPPSPSRFWFGAEFLAWSTKRASMPPLVTLGDPADPIPGALGQPGTRILSSGGSDDLARTAPGLRLRGGYAIDNAWAVEASAFMLQARSARFAAQSDATGSPIIGRPVIFAGIGVEGSFVDSFPGILAGGVTVNSSSSFWGLEANAARQLSSDRGGKVELLFGARYLRLHDRLRIDDNVLALTPGFLTFLGGPADPPATMTDFDQFSATNDFYGAQLGLRSSLAVNRWTFSGSGKLALGVTRQTVGIDGATSLLTPGAPTVMAPGGLLALTSNIGTYHSNQFAVVPELELTTGYEIFPNAVISVGYNIIYWSNVVRAADQVDRTVNTALAPSSQDFGTPGGPARPAFTFNRTDYWAQGLNVGFNFRF
jgi:hypothetical protein